MTQFDLSTNVGLSSEYVTALSDAVDKHLTTKFYLRLLHFVYYKASKIMSWVHPIPTTLQSSRWCLGDLCDASHA